MKKYIELRENDTLTEKDECRYVYGKKWIPNVHHSQMDGFEYRRPVPYEGKVAFLVTYSPVIHVVIDTTGLNDEQIDEKLIDAARSKFKVYREHHMNEFGDNIDWKQTKEDTEVPFIEEPKYRMLEIGDTVQEGDEYKHLLADEYSPVTKSIGKEVTDEVVGNFRRRIVEEPKNLGKYRFLETGDIIQADDEYLFPGGWHSIPSIMVGDEFNEACDSKSIRRPIT